MRRAGYVCGRQIPAKEDIAHVWSRKRRGKGGGVGGEHRSQGKEMLPTLVVGWWDSAVRGEEAGSFPEVVGVSIVVALHVEDQISKWTFLKDTNRSNEREPKLRTNLLETWNSCCCSSCVWTHSLAVVFSLHGRCLGWGVNSLWMH